MTTPERLRARQRRELRAIVVIGILLVGLGAAQLATYVHFKQLDQRQRSCIAQNLGGLIGSLTVRGEIASRESRAARLESRANRLESRALNQEFLPRAFAATTQTEVFEAYGAYRVQLSKVNAMRAKVDNRRQQIKVDRAGTPIPDFPAGRCE